MSSNKELIIKLPESKYSSLIEYFLKNLHTSYNLLENVTVDEFIETHGDSIITSIFNEESHQEIKALIEFLENQEIDELRLKKIKAQLRNYILKDVSESEDEFNCSILKNYQIAVDVSNIVSKTDRKGIITYVNDKFCEISGYSREELIGKPHNIVRHSEMPKEAFENLWDTIQAGKIWEGVVKNRKKDGGVYIVDATILPIFDEDGEIIEYIGIRHDLTKLVRITKEAGDYKKAVDLSNIVSKTDRKGIITYVNDKFCEISGYSREELIGKPHNIVRHSEMPKEAFENLWDTIQAGKVWQGVVKNRKKDGGVYIVDATILPLFNENDEIVEYIGIRHDLTELMIQKEREKERIEQALESIQKATKIAIDSLLKSIPMPSIIVGNSDIVEGFNDEFFRLFDIELDNELISKLKSKELKIDSLFQVEEGFIYSDDLFSWRENLNSNEEDRVKIKDVEFLIKTGEFEINSESKITICFKQIS